MGENLAGACWPTTATLWLPCDKDVILTMYLSMDLYQVKISSDFECALTNSSANKDTGDTIYPGSGPSMR